MTLAEATAEYRAANAALFRAVVAEAGTFARECETNIVSIEENKGVRGMLAASVETISARAAHRLAGERYDAARERFVRLAAEELR